MTTYYEARVVMQLKYELRVYISTFNNNIFYNYFAKVMVDQKLGDTFNSFFFKSSALHYCCRLAIGVGRNPLQSVVKNNQAAERGKLDCLT